MVAGVPVHPAGELGEVSGGQQEPFADVGGTDGVAQEVENGVQFVADVPEIERAPIGPVIEAQVGDVACDQRDQRGA